MTTRSTSTKPRRKYRLLIVDDHPVLRDGFAQLISSEPDLQVCGHTGNSVKALYDIAALKPDLVILETALKSCNGIELIKRIKTVCADVPILAFSIHEEPFHAERALRKAEQTLRLMADNLHETMIAFNMEHRLTYVNLAFERLTGSAIGKLTRQVCRAETLFPSLELESGRRPIIPALRRS